MQYPKVQNKMSGSRIITKYRTKPQDALQRPNSIETVNIQNEDISLQHDAYKLTQIFITNIAPTKKIQY